MKSKYKIFLVALLGTLLMGLLPGCSKERAFREGGSPSLGGEGVTVTFGLRVGLATYSVPAEEYEKKITDLQALIFDSSDTFVAIPDLKTIADPSGEMHGFEWDKTGAFKMLVVANHKFSADDLTGQSLSQVSKMLISSAEPGTADHFVMASDATDFTVTAGTPSKLGTVALTRLAARIDIQTTLDKLVLTKVTLTNRKTQSTLLASTDTDTHTKESKEYTSFTVLGKSGTGSASMGQIYTYENGKPGSDSEGSILKIEATFDGHPVKPVELQLPALRRNHIYTLQLINDKREYDPTKDRLSFTLTVLDWNTGATLTLSEEDLLALIADQTMPFTPVPEGILSRMAEWNVKSDGSWDKDHTIPVNPDDPTYLMNWEKAMELTMPTGYHLPSDKELCSILPEDNYAVYYGTERSGTTSPITPIDSRKSLKQESYAALLNGEVVSNPASQFAYEDDVCYALRFVGTKHESAWEYRIVKQSGKNMLRIRSIGIKDPTPEATVVAVVKWADKLFGSPDATVRFLPLTCTRNYSGGAQGEAGYYWSISRRPNSADCFSISLTGADESDDDRRKLFSVRPFVGAPKVSFQTQKDRVLSRMAEWNLKTDGTWDKDHTIPQPTDPNYSVLVMNWQVAVSVRIPAGYHMPTDEEFMSICPPAGNPTLEIKFDKSDGETSPTFITDRNSVVRQRGKAYVGNLTIIDVFCQYAYAPGVTYALRFIGSECESAWKYEFIGEVGKKMLRITSVGLKDFKGTVLDVKENATKLFSSSDATTRTLPTIDGSYGKYWGDRTNIFQSYALYLGFNGHDLKSWTTNDEPACLLRPFAD